MQELRANTQVKVKIGPAVAVANGYVPVTTLDLSTADEAELFKHDAAAVTDISAATFAAITSADGYYNLTLTTSHTDTEGLLDVIINDDSLMLPIKASFMVLAEAAWDSKYVAKDDGFMDVNIKTVGRADTQETEATNLEAACAAYSATRGLSGTALPAAAADGAGGLPISDAGGFDVDNRAMAAAAITNANTVFNTDFANNYNTSADRWKADITHSLGTAITNSDFTIASATASTVTLPTTYTNGDSLPDDDRLIYTELQVVGGTGAGQVVLLTTAAAGARTYDVLSGTMPVQLDNTSECFILGKADVAQTGDSFALIGTAGAGLTNINLPNQTMDIVGNITGNLSGSVGSVSGAVGSVTGTVGGNVTGSVGSVATGGITRASFAADTGLLTIRSNTASGGAGSTITLDGSASAVNDFYNNDWIYITGGTGVGQVRQVRDYVGSSKVATIAPAWTTTPDNTSTFAILPGVSSWEEIMGDHVTASTTGASLNAAGSAGDPWTTVLPGAYGAGTAGYAIGTYLDGAVTSRLAPTVAGRTLDVSAGGEAGIDWANVGTPGSTVNLTATTVSGVTTVATATNVTTVNGLAANVITASAVATDAGAEIAAAVWDLATVGHTTSGTFGAAMNAAGSAGDPWATSLPGAYGAGTAGRLVGRSLPDVLAGDASGLLIAGSNAATTFATLAVTGAFSAGTNSIPWNASWDAEVQSEVADALEATVADSVPADGTRPSIAQGIYMMTQAIVECSISGTTLTVKKPDGSTTLFTVTLNDATTPTSKTRAT
jgi:hypothetical protein